VRQRRHRVKHVSGSTAPNRIEGIACGRVVGGTPPPAWDGSESQQETSRNGWHPTADARGDLAKRSSTELTESGRQLKGDTAR